MKIPLGTRDVLPEEMREIRAISTRMRATFEDAGYGEVHTPALEYEDVLRRGDERAAGARYRTFDERGDVLALRSDMTIPIARVVATRYADVEPPLRFCYFAHAWRAVGAGRRRAARVPPGRPRADRRRGTSRRRRGARPDGRGARRRRPAPSSRGRRRRLAVPQPARWRWTCRWTSTCRCSSASRAVTSSGSACASTQLGVGERERDLLVGLPELRGGREVLERADGVPPSGRRRSRGCASCTSCSPSGVSRSG